MTVTAVLTPAGSGTKVHMDQDLHAVRRGGAVRPRHDRRRHGGPDGPVRRQRPARIGALERGESVESLAAKPASGLSIGLQAARMALMRVFRRFFLPYQPNPS